VQTSADTGDLLGIKIYCRSIRWVDNDFGTAYVLWAEEKALSTIAVNPRCGVSGL
jgi:hypothetical protein